MKISSTLLLTISTLLISVSCKRKVKVVNRCKNTKFCVNSKMPLLSQGSSKLHPEIKKLSKNKKIKKDTGWCSAVASTMALAGEKLIAPKNVKHHSHIQAVTKIKHKSNINDRTKSYARTIFNVGQTIKTNWEKGGTSDNNRSKGVSKLYKKLKINKRKQSRSLKDKHVKYSMPTKTLINMYKKDKPALATSFYYYDKQSNGSYKIKGGHALTVNGYEDGKVKIYDPWGRIYNVQLGKDNASGLKKKAIVKHVSGDSGFVKSYSSSKRKIAFQRYNSLYSRNKK